MRTTASEATAWWRAHSTRARGAAIAAFALLTTCNAAGCGAVDSDAMVVAESGSTYPIDEVYGAGAPGDAASVEHGVTLRQLHADLSEYGSRLRVTAGGHVTDRGALEGQTPVVLVGTNRPRCALGDRWRWIRPARTLGFLLVCSDGVHREGEFLVTAQLPPPFDTAPLREFWKTELTLVSVGGESATTALVRGPWHPYRFALADDSGP